MAQRLIEAQQDELTWLNGQHFLGGGDSGPDLQALYADGYRPRWVKFVTDANHVASRAPFLPPGTKIIWRLYEKGPFNSDRIDLWQGSDLPEPSARRLANHLDPDLHIVSNIGRTVALDGPWNETGQGDWYAEFCFHLAKILYFEYNGMLLAAFGSSAGSYNEAQVLNAQGFPDKRLIRQQIVQNAAILSANNDADAVREVHRIEAQNAQVIASKFVIPMLAANLPVFFSLHAYASLLPMVWHGGHRQKPSIANIWNSGATGDLFGWNDFMPASVLDDAGGAPPTYTGFGWIRLLWHLKHLHNIDLKRLSLLLTENGVVDNLGDCGIGATAGGWKQYVQRGLWDRLRLAGDDFEMVAGRALFYIEQQMRIFEPLLAELAGMSFTHNDKTNPTSRWQLEYATEGGPLNFYKHLVRQAGGTPKPDPTLPSLDGFDHCRIATRDASLVNIRSTPEVAVDNRVAGMSPFETYRATHHAVNPIDGLWYRLQTPAGFARADVVRINNQCDDLPEWTEQNGEEPVMSNMGFVYWEPEGQEGASVEQLAAPVHTVYGNERSAAAVAQAQNTDCVLRFWFDDGPRNPGNWMQQMRGKSTGEMVNTWFEAAPIDQYVNKYRKQTVESPSTGSAFIVENPEYNPRGIMWLLDGDAVDVLDLPAFFAFQAGVLRQLEARTVVIGLPWHLQIGLRGAVINRDIRFDDQEWLWEQARLRGLLDALVDTGGYLRLKVKANKPFHEHRRSEIFPVQTYGILGKLGYLNQLQGKVILQAEYAGGHRGLGLSADTVVKDMALLAREARQDINIAAVNFFLRGDATTPGWIPDHDVGAAIEQRVADIIRGTAPSPVVDWLPEDEPPPPPPPPNEGGGCWDWLHRIIGA